MKVIVSKILQRELGIGPDIELSEFREKFVVKEDNQAMYLKPPHNSIVRVAVGRLTLVGSYDPIAEGVLQQQSDPA